MTATNQYEHILVPTDFSPEAQEAYQVALVAARGSGARVSLLHVLPQPSDEEYAGMDAFRLLHRAAERSKSWQTVSLDPASDVVNRCLDRLQAEIHPECRESIDFNPVVRTGNVVEEIARFAKESQADLIVTGGSRRGRLGVMLPGVADRLTWATPVHVIRVTASRADEVRPPQE